MIEKRGCKSLFMHAVRMFSCYWKMSENARLFVRSDFADGGACV